MANPENLRTPTSSEAREIGRKGGIASGAARRKKKSCADIAMRVINSELDPASRAKVEKVTGKLSDDEDTLYAAALAQVVAKAVKGDLKAFRELQNVVEKTQIGYQQTEREDDPLSAALKELGEAL